MQRVENCLNFIKNQSDTQRVWRFCLPPVALNGILGNLGTALDEISLQKGIRFLSEPP